eukprot:CAMPEP_0206293010 /NCGR_PEP_ID=MMETSP0106_2-20121207/3921_1 /ASSEMBLY_ACC=CAM_ASM_000206 /TAXON_ID=81532 /ORGANISM="Acanthoeca-like sp., Strain 10tr" /LENGTH=84 /DNA_ID=CAMNT_0053723601 /DNA_START=728 /DNA_END=977 /DNA_ORIENTATION=-
MVPEVVSAGGVPSATSTTTQSVAAVNHDATVTTVPPNTGAAAGTTVEVGEIPVSTNVTTGATAGPVVTTAEVGEPPLVTADGTT